jgi:beta-lactamase class A
MLVKTLSASLLVVSLAAPATGADRGALLETIRGAAARGGGDVGVAVVHVESGERLSLRGGERFPMFSVYKLPIAIEFLSRVDRGQNRLDEPVRIEVSDLRPWASPLAERAAGRPLIVTARELVEQMISASDNTACDVLLRLCGGPGAVTDRMRALGLPEIRVDRLEVEISADLTGVPLPPVERRAPARLRDLFRSASEASRRAAFDRSLQDPRDTATPAAAADLLARVQRRQILKDDTSRLLMEALEGTTTGPRRLRGLLPAGTRVAHKTGSGPVVGGRALGTNDAGLVELPGGRGQLAVVVLIKASDRDEATRERAIAEIARAVMTPSPPTRRRAAEPRP